MSEINVANGGLRFGGVDWPKPQAYKGYVENLLMETLSKMTRR